MNRLPGLDLLRAFAIVWVMLFHAQIMGLGTPALAFTKLGWMGVDLFFVLSGFLIGSQWLASCVNGTQRLSDFYLRRALRILPAYLVVVAAYFGIAGWREAAQIQPLWQFLTFTENLFIDITNGKAFSHVWSLCVEEHFYLLFPLLALAMLRRPGWRKVVGVMLGLVLAGMAWRGYVWWTALQPLQLAGDDNFTARYHEWIYYPSHTRLDGLLAGVMLAAIKVYRPQHWQRLMLKANWLLLGGGISLAASIVLFQQRFELLPTVLGYPLLAFSLALWVAAAASPQSLLGRWRLPGANLLATLAYSLYLSHKGLFHLAKVQFGEALAGHGALAFAVYSGAALLGASLLYLLIERPVLRWRDHLPRATSANPTGITLVNAVQ